MLVMGSPKAQAGSKGSSQAGGQGQLRLKSWHRVFFSGHPNQERRL